jgi:hypothetical protein
MEDTDILRRGLYNGTPIQSSIWSGLADAMS